MEFFTQAVNVLKILVMAVGAGLGACMGVINLMEGYGNDNPGAKSQGIKQLMAGWRCRSDRYTACTITGEFVLAGAVGKENTHG